MGFADVIFSLIFLYLILFSRASSLAGECQRSERKCKALQDNENRLTVEKVKIEAKLDELTQSSRRDVELMAAEKVRNIILQPF